MLTLALLSAALLSQPAQDTTVPVPAGARLILSTHSGSIMVRTWDRAAVQVSGGDGRGRVHVDVERGVVRVGRSSSRDGDYRLTVPAWMALELSTTEGDIAVSGSAGRLNLTSVEGQVRVRGGREFVAVHSVEGDVNVSDVVGRVEVNTVDGAINLVGIQGDVYADAVDGAITMEDIRSTSVEANTVDGDILYRGTIEGQGRYRLGSHDGDITLEVPALDAVLSINTFEGDFETCGYQPVMTGGRDQNRRRFRATVGSGKAQVDLESFDGTIYVVKTGCE